MTHSLWCLKLSLLTFYSRLVEHVAWGKPVIRVLWWTIMLTFLGVLITTVAECRPLHLYFPPLPASSAFATDSFIVGHGNSSRTETVSSTYVSDPYIAD